MTADTALARIAVAGFCVNNLFQRDDGRWQANLRKNGRGESFAYGATAAEALLACAEAAEAERAAAYRRGAEAMREAAARSQMCGCQHAANIMDMPPNSARRWNACGETNCAAIIAAEIRALPIPGEAP